MQYFLFMNLLGKQWPFLKRRFAPLVSLSSTKATYIFFVSYIMAFLIKFKLICPTCFMTIKVQKFVIWICQFNETETVSLQYVQIHNIWFRYKGYLFLIASNAVI